MVIKNRMIASSFCSFTLISSFVPIFSNVWSLFGRFQIKSAMRNGHIAVSLNTVSSPSLSYAIPPKKLPTKVPKAREIQLFA